MVKSFSQKTGEIWRQNLNFENPRIFILNELTGNQELFTSYRHPVPG